MSQYQPLAGLLNESEVLGFLGITKPQLDVLRHQGLPFVKVNTRRRCYFEQDLLEFLGSKRVVLNKAERDVEDT
jgi:hypothetical protein